jgi:hypothetical protein
MNIEVYMRNSEIESNTSFAGNIDGKEFDFTVEEFINLIGAFQKVAAKVQGVELKDEEVISTDTISAK